MFPSVIPVFPLLSFPTLVPDVCNRGSSVIGNPGFCARRTRTHEGAEEKNLSSSPPPLLSSSTLVIEDPGSLPSLHLPLSLFVVLSNAPVLSLSKERICFSLLSSSTLVIEDPGSLPSLHLPLSLFVILSNAPVLSLSKERICFSMRSVVERKKVPPLRSRQSRRVE